MNDSLLLAYLNDHLAGSVAGIETAESLRDRHAGSELANVLDELLREIKEDQDVLKDLIVRCGGRQNVVKKASAWLGEKAARLKTLGTSPAAAAFGRMEQFEALMLGIRGKLALWDVLEDLAPSDSRLQQADWTALKRRAADQVERVNALRRQTAREAFLPEENR